MDPLREIILEACPGLASGIDSLVVVRKTFRCNQQLEKDVDEQWKKISDLEKQVEKLRGIINICRPDVYWSDIVEKIEGEEELGHEALSYL